MKTIVIEVSLDGQIDIDAQNYQGRDCMKSQLVQKLMQFIKNDGEIDQIEEKYSIKDIQYQTLEEVI